MGPPSVFRLSVPHSTMAMVSGSAFRPPRWRSRSAGRLPLPVLHREGARAGGRGRSRAGCAPSAGYPGCAAGRRPGPVRTKRPSRACTQRIELRVCGRACWRCRAGGRAPPAALRIRAFLSSACTGPSRRSSGVERVRACSLSGQSVDSPRRWRPACPPAPPLRRLADHVQAVRDQRVFELQEVATQVFDGPDAGGFHASARRPESSSRGLGSWIRPRARCALRSGFVLLMPRQRSMEPLSSLQALVETGIGDRRGQIADQGCADRRLAIVPSDGLLAA
jgi:hypothetical protein